MGKVASTAKGSGKSKRGIDEGGYAPSHSRERKTPAAEYIAGILNREGVMRQKKRTWTEVLPPVREPEQHSTLCTTDALVSGLEIRNHPGSINGEKKNLLERTGQRKGQHS